MMGGNNIDEAEVLTAVIADTLVEVSALLLAFTVTELLCCCVSGPEETTGGVGGAMIGVGECSSG